MYRQLDLFGLDLLDVGGVDTRMRGTGPTGSSSTQEETKSSAVAGLPERKE